MVEDLESGGGEKRGGNQGARQGDARLFVSACGGGGGREMHHMCVRVRVRVRVCPHTLFVCSCVVFVHVMRRATVTIVLIAKFPF